MRLSVMHNLYFYNKLMERIRESLDSGTFAEFRAGIRRNWRGRSDRAGFILKNCSSRLAK